MFLHIVVVGVTVAELTLGLAMLFTGGSRGARLAPKRPDDARGAFLVEIGGTYSSRMAYGTSYQRPYTDFCPHGRERADRHRDNTRTRQFLGCTHHICYYLRRVRATTNNGPGSSWDKLAVTPTSTSAGLMQHSIDTFNSDHVRVDV